MKISKKYSPVLFAFIMAILLPFVVTFFIVLINIGFTDDFFMRWMKSWLLTFFVAFPAIYFIAPFVRRIVSKITE